MPPKQRAGQISAANPRNQVFKPRRPGAGTRKGEFPCHSCEAVWSTAAGRGKHEKSCITATVDAGIVQPAVVLAVLIVVAIALVVVTLIA